jgi:hypothetical protein
MANTATMAERKIIVCTTFREFNGNSNDQIQRLFLRTLKKQTYQNYTLVATTFGEKNVETALAEEGIPHRVFAGNAGEGYRFSATQVLENGIKLIDAPGSYIIIWTTCDDLYDPSFFEKIITTLTPLSACTSLPHVTYRTIEDYEAKNISSYCYGGIDLVCFDADIFLNPEVQEAVRAYPNKGWGLFEYFLSGIGRVFAKKMYNVWPAKIERINNDRKANNETKSYFDMSTEHNRASYQAFVKKYNIKGDMYASIFAYKTPLRYAKTKFMIALMITRYRLENSIYKSKAFISVPPSIKKLFKKALVNSKDDRA